MGVVPFVSLCVISWWWLRSSDVNIYYCKTLMHGNASALGWI